MFSNPYIHIILSTTGVYLFIILALRILGKTELAQLSVTDLIFVLLISNAVQNAMVGSDTSLGGGILAASVLFVINFIFKKLKYKFPNLRKVLEGEPVILIHHGKMIESNCKKNGITKEELLQAIREHGSHSMEEIDSLILETDGNISVVSNEYKHHSIRRLKKRKNS
jgi:uncharacterized membrane protein YcaP (DUF421 family)